jgi:uncharacterized coiled-coil DUF342 family protein
MSNQSINNATQGISPKTKDTQGSVVQGGAVQEEKTQSILVQPNITKRVPEAEALIRGNTSLKDHSITGYNKISDSLVPKIIQDLNNINANNVDVLSHKVSDAVKNASSTELFALFDKINSLESKGKVIQELKDIAVNQLPARWLQLIVSADEITSIVKSKYKQINKEVAFCKRSGINVNTTGIHTEIKQSFIKMLDEQKHIDKTLKPEKNSIIISEKTGNRVYEITAYFHNIVANLLDKTAFDSQQKKTNQEISSLLDLYEANIDYSDQASIECKVAIDQAVALSKTSLQKHDDCVQLLDVLLKYIDDRKQILNDINSAKTNKNHQSSIKSFLNKLYSLFKKTPLDPQIITEDDKVISGVDYFNQSNKLNIEATTQLADDIIAVDEKFKEIPRYESLKNDITEYSSQLEFLQNNDNTLHNYHLYLEADRVHKKLEATNGKALKFAVEHINKFINNQQALLQDTTGKTSIIFEYAFKKTMDKLFDDTNLATIKQDTSAIISEYSKQLSSMVSSLGKFTDQLGIDVNAIDVTGLTSATRDTIKDEDVQWDYKTEELESLRDSPSIFDSATTEDIAKIDSDDVKHKSNSRDSVLDMLENESEIATQGGIKKLFNRVKSFLKRIFMIKKPTK